MLERDLRDIELAAQDDVTAQRDALWHLLEACECFGGPAVRALARKRFEVFDGADVREDVAAEQRGSAVSTFTIDW